jgi:hypothetical protein
VNLDVSIAPEIAQLMGPGPDRSRERPAASPAPVASAAPAGAGTAGGPPPTVGDLARQLRLITAAPERWWQLVRFDPERAVRISIPAPGPGEIWLLVIPPSAHGEWMEDGGECGCEVVSVIAGEVTEQAIGECGVATTPLLPGRMRVHGSSQLHQVVNRSAGYTVSVHARARATSRG